MLSGSEASEVGHLEQESTLDASLSLSMTRYWLARADASLPLSMTREGTFVMP
jgi:hypothetical protein